MTCSPSKCGLDLVPIKALELRLVVADSSYQECEASGIAVEGSSNVG